MTQITRVPWGLQDFLGTQAQGKNPSELAQVVAPTLDLGPFLGIEKETWLFADPGAFTASLNHVEIVPEGELWILTGIGMNHNASGVGVGDGYTFTAAIENVTNSSTPTSYHAISGRPYAYSWVSSPGVEYHLETIDNVVCWPGTSIHWLAQQVTRGAGSFTSKCVAKYVKLAT